jgi:hypothetical protein
MYTKYNLSKSRECREYFAENYIVKYHQNLKEAKSLGIETDTFFRKYFSEFKESMRCYFNNHFSKK